MLTQSLRSLSDDTLLSSLGELLRDSRRVEAELVAHIGEVEARRLYLREACSSMFAYCVERLRLSEPEAYLRLAAARASRRYPVVLEMLRDGRLHLSAIAAVARYLTDANHLDVLRRAAHRTKVEVLELIAELAPKPDAPTLVRRLPRDDARAADAAARPRSAAFANLTQGEAVFGRPTEPLLRVASPDSSPAHRFDPAETTEPADLLRLGEVRLRDCAHADGATTESPATTAAGDPGPRTPPLPALTKPASVIPTAPDRYKVQFTASTVLKRKLERLQTLMLGAVPDGDLARLIEAAVTAHIERLEKERLGAAKAPRKTVAESDTRPGPRHIPDAVKRAVRERDGNRCAYVDATGHRCCETRELQFHHRIPHAMGGDRSPENIQLRCRWHNEYEAERDYGRPHGRLQRARGARSRPSLVTQPASGSSA